MTTLWIMSKKPTRKAQGHPLVRENHKKSFCYTSPWFSRPACGADKHPDATIVAKEYSESDDSGKPEGSHRGLTALQSGSLCENGLTASQGGPKVGEGRLKAPPFISIPSLKWWVLFFVLYLHVGQSNESQTK